MPPTPDLLHFIHTPSFDESMHDVPMTDIELRSVQSALQADPEAGDRVPGVPGLMKVRVAVKGRGKRGGARVLYYYKVRSLTVFLLLAYSKSEADDLSDAGKKMIRDLIAELEQE